jgi:hypothetical protein
MNPKPQNPKTPCSLNLWNMKIRDSFNHAYYTLDTR